MCVCVYEKHSNLQKEQERHKESKGMCVVCVCGVCVCGACVVFLRRHGKHVRSGSKAH